MTICLYVNEPGITFSLHMKKLRKVKLFSKYYRIVSNSVQLYTVLITYIDWVQLHMFDLDPIILLLWSNRSICYCIITTRLSEKSRESSISFFYLTQTPSPSHWWSFETVACKNQMQLVMGHQWYFLKSQFPVIISLPRKQRLKSPWDFLAARSRWLNLEEGRRGCAQIRNGYSALWNSLWLVSKLK